MTGWRKVQLKDVAEQCLGKMLDAQKNRGRLLPYLRNPNVRWFDIDTSDLREMPFEDTELTRFGLLEGDVLVCEGGEAGRAAIWDGRLPDVKFQKAIHRVRPGPELYNRFLVHRLFFDHQTGKLADYYTGATIKHLTGQDLARYRFGLPPLAEQHRIADVLDRADALRSQRRAAIAELDTLTQAIFLDMFGDPVSALWPLLAVEELIKPGGLRTGPFGSQLLHSEFVDQGVAVLGIDNVVSNEFRWDQRRFISVEKYREMERYTVHGGDVLVTIMGTCGRCAMVPDDIGVAINTKHLCCITLDQEQCLPVFLHAYFLRHPLAKQHLGQSAKGAVMPGLNMGIIRSLPIRLPPLELQRKFSHHVEALEKLKAAQRSSLAELDALFAALQHRAFRGEL